MNNKENSRTRQIEFLKTHFNKSIVDSAVKYADSQIEDHSSYPHDSIMLQLAKKMAIKCGQQEIADFIEHQIEIDAQDSFNLLTFAYTDGVMFGLENQNINVTPEPVTEYVLGKDFSFIFDYGDNDFGELMLRAAKKYCDEYNSLLRLIELYSKCDSNIMVESYKKDLEYMENPDNIRSLMKALFIGEYMSKSADRFWLEKKQFDATKRLKRAEELANNYFQFDDEIIHFDTDNTEKIVWKFGTWNEVSNYGAEHYKGLQCKEELEYSNGDFTKYWLNGEVLIVRMLNGKLIAETK